MMRPIVLISFEKETLDLGDGYTVQYGNPRFYKSPRPKYDMVYAPSYPNIEKDYEKLGKKIFRKSSTDTSSESVSTEEVDAVTEGKEEPETQQEVHWSELSWPKMRSLATNFTDEPIKTKEQAQEILSKAEQDGDL